jgi:hypothetical protein
VPDRDRETVKERRRGSAGDLKILRGKMEKGPTSQSVQAAFGSWKRQEMDSSQSLDSLPFGL